MQLLLQGTWRRSAARPSSTILSRSRSHRAIAPSTSQEQESILRYLAHIMPIMSCAKSKDRYARHASLATPRAVWCLITCSVSPKCGTMAAEKGNRRTMLSLLVECRRAMTRRSIPPILVVRRTQQFDSMTMWTTCTSRGRICHAM